jgi:hypothetical protein
MVVAQVLPAEADRAYQEIMGAMETTEIPHAAVLSHPPVTLDCPRALLSPPILLGTGRNPTDPMEEMIDETNSPKAAREVGQVTWTHMFRITMTVMIVHEILASMALQIPIGAHRAGVITGVNRPGGGVEALALEMAVEDKKNYQCTSFHSIYNL